MLRWISMLGGLPIMMGHQARSEALFYYFRLEDHIPENHLLRLIDNHISFDFVRQHRIGCEGRLGHLVPPLLYFVRKTKFRAEITQPSAIREQAE